MPLNKPTYYAQVPSNIAFLKYWGKSDTEKQWPANSSLSMTLNAINTETRVTLSESADFEVQLGDTVVSRGSKQGDKIFKHLDYLEKQFGFTSKLAIKTRNSFPTGCGIASSASGLGALTLACLCAWTKSASFEDLEKAGFTRNRLAELARLGSGSACRSLYGGYVTWYRGDNAEEQRVEQSFQEDHWPLRDTVVLFSQSEKKVGSTAAHKAAWSSPLFAPRLAIIEKKLQLMQEAISQRDFHTLGTMIEEECLEMHSVIMSATPPVFYFDKETSSFLSRLRRFRAEENLEAYFTLDAGPNVHIIHTPESEEKLMTFLNEELPGCSFLTDTIGSGPRIGLEVN